MYLYVIVIYFNTILFVIAKSILKNVMFTWTHAVDEMYVTSLPANYPLRIPASCLLIYIWESAPVMQFAYHIHLGKCTCDAICISCAAYIFPPNCIKCTKMKNTVTALIYRLFTHYNANDADIKCKKTTSEIHKKHCKYF